MKVKLSYAIICCIIIFLPLTPHAKEAKDIFLQIGHSREVTSVCFSPDGKLMASGSWDNTIKLWNVKDGALIRTFKGNSSSVESVIFSPDGCRIASGGYYDTIKLWNVKDGALIRTFKGHTNDVNSVSFSPNGSRIVSGSDDKTIKLWDVKDGALIRTFKGHSSGVNSVSFSPDGSRIASGSADTTIKLWNVHNENDSYTYATLPDNEWISLKSGQLYYKSSPNGDKYAAIRYNNNTFHYEPLSKYRNQYKVTKGLFQSESPAIIKNQPVQQPLYVEKPGIQNRNNHLTIQLQCKHEGKIKNAYDIDEDIAVYLKCPDRQVKIKYNENQKIFTGIPSCTPILLNVNATRFKNQTYPINTTKTNFAFEMQFKQPVLYVLINPGNQLNIDPLKSYAPNFDQMKNKLRKISNQLDGNKRDYWNDRWLRTYFYTQNKGRAPVVLNKQGIIATKWDDPDFIKAYNKKIYFQNQGIGYQQLIDEACTFFKGFSISDDLNLKGAALFIIGAPDDTISLNTLKTLEHQLRNNKACALIAQFGTGEQNYTANTQRFKYLKLIQFDMKKEFYQNFFQPAFERIVKEFENQIDKIENQN